MHVLLGSAKCMYRNAFHVPNFTAHFEAEFCTVQFFLAIIEGPTFFGDLSWDLGIFYGILPLFSFLKREYFANLLGFTQLPGIS